MSTITNTNRAGRIAEETGRIAEELRAQRRQAGLTQAQLAGLAGCSLSMLAAIEGGAVPRVSPTLERIQAVLTAIESVHSTQ